MSTVNHFPQTPVKPIAAGIAAAYGFYVERPESSIQSWPCPECQTPEALSKPRLTACKTCGGCKRLIFA